MGNDSSKDLASLELDIPACLRSVHPFLYDAQRGIINLQQMHKTHHDTLNIAKRKKIIISNINHAVNILNMLNNDLPPEGIQCLENYFMVRHRFVTELPQRHKMDVIELEKYNPHKEQQPSHEILIREADEAMALAELQLSEGFSTEASQSYHTACIYYKVMQAMVPTVESVVRPKLQNAAQMARFSASLTRNFVREHFANGRTCADVYEVHGASKLGKGSYGSVYLSTHRITGDERAVKVMNVDRVTSYYLRKLHTEIEILKAVDHPNIIKLQDVFFGKRSVYLVTDLCRGGELFELLNSGKNQGFVFKEDRVAKLMKDMLSAVHYLHSKGIVHRDLKLENFLFEDRDSNSPLILIDFGLSKTFEPGEVLTQRVGSCYYTAPEVLNSAYDYRCDIWSLGVLCYMLLTGSPPFHGKDVEDVYDAILKQEAVYPEKKFRHSSAQCMDFLRRFLVKDVNHRITTAAALAHPFIMQCSAPPNQSPGPSQSQGANSNLPPSPHTRGNLFRGGSSHLPSLPPLTKDAPAHKVNYGPGVKVFNVDEASGIVDCMAMFISADPLIKLILVAVAHTLPCEMVVELRDEYTRIDTDCNGSISYPEFTHALGGARQVQAGEVDLSIAYSAISIDRSHGHAEEMSYHEYIAAAMCKRLEIDDTRIQAVFDMLDGERTGCISAASIRNAIGNDIPEHVLSAMIGCASPVHAQAVASGGGGGLNEDLYLNHWNRFYVPWARALQSHSQSPMQRSLSRGSSERNCT